MNAAEIIYLLVVIPCDVQFGSVDILGGKKLYVFFGLIFFFLNVKIHVSADLLQNSELLSCLHADGESSEKWQHFQTNTNSLKV